MKSSLQKKSERERKEPDSIEEEHQRREKFDLSAENLGFRSEKISEMLQ